MVVFVTRTCVVCGAEFERESFRRTMTCSMPCKKIYLVEQSDKAEIPWPKPEMTELQALKSAGGPKYDEVTYNTGRASP